MAVNKALNLTNWFSYGYVIDTIVFVGLKWYLGVYPSANAWAKSQPENNVMENKHYIPMENAS